MYPALYMVFQFLKKAVRYRFLYFVLGVIFLVVQADHYSEAKKISGYKNNPMVEATIRDASITDSIINLALTLEGVPYQYGGKSVKGFDCSGFIYYVLHAFDIPIPRSSAQQYLSGEAIAVEEVQKGDLVFFTGTQNRRVGHVGIIITGPGEKPLFIHSSSGGGGRGVTVDSLSHPHYQARFLGARRVIEKG